MQEALEYAKQEFQSAALRTDRVVRFIVGTSLDGLFDECHCQRGVFYGGFSPVSGKGLHSEAGKAKIRPALEQLCDEYVNVLECYICVLTLGRILGVGINTTCIPGMLECLSFSVNAKNPELNVASIYELSCYMFHFTQDLLHIGSMRQVRVTKTEQGIIGGSSLPVPVYPSTSLMISRWFTEKSILPLPRPLFFKKDPNMIRYCISKVRISNNAILFDRFVRYINIHNIEQVHR